MASLRIAAFCKVRIAMAKGRQNIDGRIECSIWANNGRNQGVRELSLMAPLAGLEPALLAPEASALSSELQGHTRIILRPPNPFKRVESNGCGSAARIGNRRAVSGQRNRMTTDETSSATPQRLTNDPHCFLRAYSSPVTATLFSLTSFLR